MQACHLSLLSLLVFKLQPQRKALEEHVDLVLDSERLKGLEDCQGKLYFPLLPMFWEHLSNRVLTS